MRRLLTYSAVILLASVSVECLSMSRTVAFRSSNDGTEQLRGRVTSLLQQLGSSPSGGMLPSVGRALQSKTDRRAFKLGSRLEPVARESLSPGVKAMRYGKRSSGTAAHFSP